MNPRGQGAQIGIKGESVPGLPAALAVLLGLWPEPLIYVSGAAAEVLTGAGG